MTNQIATQTGLQAIADMFAGVRAQGRAAFLPYFPIGYPTYEASLNAIAAMAEVGVDGFEIGIPFSDPLADGPTIQAATQVALENGISVRRCLAAVMELRGSESSRFTARDTPTFTCLARSLDEALDSLG